MSIKNGPKKFLYAVCHQHADKGDGGQSNYLILADRDPTVVELISLLHLDYEPEDGEALEIERYDLDALPTLPPKP